MVELLDEILEKRELRGVNRSFAERILTEYFFSHPELAKKSEEGSLRKNELAQIKKDVRASLRDMYGVFFTDRYPAKRDPLVEQLIAHPTQEHAKALLGIHRSTQERLDAYEFLYEQLFAVTGVPKSILDLGCGFNPFSYGFLKCRPAYHAVDIACDDLERIGQYLDSLRIEHTEHCIDLSDPENVKALPAVDVAFAFKLFDSLEDMNRDVTAALIDLIPAKWIVVSFPTMSIGQRKPIRPREWFEKLITGRLHSTVTLPNEQFFIITGRERGAVTGHQQ